MKTTEEEEIYTCEGYRTSECCGANMELDICMGCKEHTDNQCVSCEDKKECENYKSMEEL